MGRAEKLIVLSIHEAKKSDLLNLILISYQKHFNKLTVRKAKSHNFTSKTIIKIEQ